MTVERGWVDARSNSLISITLARVGAIDFVIDTGFDGELLLPLSLTESLQLRIMDEAELVLAGDVIAESFTSVAEINWMGSRRIAEVSLMEGNDHLVGTALLKGTRLRIDYIANNVEIEKP